jgi:hypothetical protein
LFFISAFIFLVLLSSHFNFVDSCKHYFVLKN